MQLDRLEAGVDERADLRDDRVRTPLGRVVARDGHEGDARSGATDEPPQRPTLVSGPCIGHRDLEERDRAPQRADRVDMRSDQVVHDSLAIGHLSTEDPIGEHPDHRIERKAARVADRMALAAIRRDDTDRHILPLAIRRPPHVHRSFERDGAADDIDRVDAAG